MTRAKLRALLFLLGCIQATTAQWVCRSRNYPNHPIGLQGDTAKIIEDQPEKWIMHSPGLWDQENSVSFESFSHPGKFLHLAEDSILRAVHFKADGFDNKMATFVKSVEVVAEADGSWKGYYHFAAVTDARWFMRHNGYFMKMTDSSVTAGAFPDDRRWTCDMETVLLSKNYPSYAFSYNSNDRYFPGKIMENDFGVTLRQPGLTNEMDTVSIEATAYPGFYFRHYGYKLYVEKLTEARNQHIMLWDATFKLHTSRYYSAYFSFESVNYPGYFLRHQGYVLKLQQEADTTLYHEDASFGPKSEPMIIISQNYGAYNFYSFPDQDYISKIHTAATRYWLVRPGLTKEIGTVSFESEDYRGRFLRHYRAGDSGDRIIYADDAATARSPSTYLEDATFITYIDIFHEKSGGFYSFESVSARDHYIRHQGYVLKVSTETTGIFQTDAGYSFVRSGCDPNTCKNGGKCTLTSGTTYSCECIGEFTGTHCETAPAYDVCSQSPCQNDGICKTNVVGWTGVFQSKNYPDYYVHAKTNSEGYIQNPKSAAIALNELSGLVTGDDDDAVYVTYQDAVHPNLYMHDRDGFIYFEELTEDVEEFTFIKHVGLCAEGYVAWESFTTENAFIRHQGYRLKVHAFDSSALYNNDRCFLARSARAAHFQSYNYPQHFVWYDAGGNYGARIQNGLSVSEEPRYDLVTGLNGGEGGVSLAAVDSPGYYLHHRRDNNNHMHVDTVTASSNLDEYTFKMVPDKFYEGTYVFESWDLSDNFMRHQGYTLKMHPSDGSTLFKQDASFFSLYDKVYYIQSKNYPQYFVGYNDNWEAYILQGDVSSAQRFRLVRGLDNTAGAVSLQSYNDPDYYLARDGGMVNAKASTAGGFTNQYATFKLIKNCWNYAGYTCLESIESPGKKMRHQGYRLKDHSSDGSQLFQDDSAFNVATDGYSCVCDANHIGGKCEEEKETTCSETSLCGEAGTCVASREFGKVTIESVSQPGWKWWFSKDSSSLLQLSQDKKDIFYTVYPGRHGDVGSTSFSLVSNPDVFLRHRGWWIYGDNWEQDNNKDLYNLDSTFVVEQDTFLTGTYTFESVNYPDYYIVSEDNKLKIAQKAENEDYKSRASWTMNPSDFECQCDASSGGTTCETSKACLDATCNFAYGASCEVSGSDPRGYTCTCTDGWSGDECRAFDLCENVDCNSGSCGPNEDQSDYVCVCPTGYEGSFCETYTNCIGHSCLNGADCIQDNSGVKAYECSCATGYEGDDCETFTACNEDPCQNGAECTEGDGGAYVCENCPAGVWTGTDCDTFVPCEAVDCNNGACGPNEDNSDFVCSCDAGYEGDTCETYTACIQNDCQSGTCTPAVNDREYECACDAGWEGADCDTFTICKEDPCLNSGVCTASGADDYTCEGCSANYNGKNCDNYVPCDGVNCNNGECQPFGEDQYKCSCSGIWAGDACDVYGPCNPDPCENGGTCGPDGQDGYQCDCEDPYSGDQCQNNIACDNDPCQNSGVCSTITGGYECDCTDQYKGSDCGTVKVCDPDPCKNGAACSLAEPDVFQCACDEAVYEGTTCDIIIACKEDPCQNGGVCLPYEGSYRCECDDLYEGSHCQTVKACNPNPCENGGTCNAAGATYSCDCLAEYTGDSCNEIVACQSDPCQNGGVCGVYEDGYACDCPEEFSGDNCNLVVACFSSPCKNGGECDAGDGGSFKCTCAEGYIGDTCDEDDPSISGFGAQEQDEAGDNGAFPQVGTQSFMIAVGAFVAIGLMALLFIIFLVIMRKSKKKPEEDAEVDDLASRPNPKPPVRAW